MKGIRKINTANGEFIEVKAPGTENLPNPGMQYTPNSARIYANEMLRLADEIKAEQADMEQKEEEPPQVCKNCKRKFFSGEEHYHGGDINHECKLTPREEQSLAAMAKLEELITENNIRLLVDLKNGKHGTIAEIWVHEGNKFAWKEFWSSDSDVSFSAAINAIEEEPVCPTCGVVHDMERKSSKIETERKPERKPVYTLEDLFLQLKYLREVVELLAEKKFSDRDQGALADRMIKLDHQLRTNASDIISMKKLSELIQQGRAVLTIEHKDWPLRWEQILDGEVELSDAIHSLGDSHD